MTEVLYSLCLEVSFQLLYLKIFLLIFKIQLAHHPFCEASVTWEKHPLFHVVSLLGSRIYSSCFSLCGHFLISFPSVSPLDRALLPTPDKDQIFLPLHPSSVHPSSWHTVSTWQVLAKQNQTIWKHMEQNSRVSSRGWPEVVAASRLLPLGAENEVTSWPFRYHVYKSSQVY